jgi:DNA-binding transcriptional MocR family regulator
MGESWQPVLEQGIGALYERLVGAMERDVRSGILARGARLPAQRDLAYRLGLSVGTVSKAYVEAERLGLIRGHVGRGTFVADEWTPSEAIEHGIDQVIDLSVNVIPDQPAARRLADTLSTLRRRRDLLDLLDYAPPAGYETHRRSGAAWLKRIANIDVDWTRLIVTTGAQHAIALAFGCVCRPGDTVLCEASTYYGMKSLAEHRGYRLRGVDMDHEGLLPDQLDRIAAETAAKALYAMPTVQNPTGRTMSATRRDQICRIIERHGLWLVEDDIYAIFAPERKSRLAPLAVTLPERCFYLGGASKSLAPGLRTGLLLCPPGSSFEAAVRAVRATIYAPSSFGSLVFSQWVDDGSAYEIVDGVRDEIACRAELARKILGPGHAGEIGDAPHFWLPMSELDAERIAGRALRAGVALTPPATPIVNGASRAGIRVCLGAAANLADLSIGLQRLHMTLSSAADRADIAMV